MKHRLAVALTGLLYLPGPTTAANWNANADKVVTAAMGLSTMTKTGQHADKRPLHRIGGWHLLFLQAGTLGLRWIAPHDR